MMAQQAARRGWLLATGIALVLAAQPALAQETVLAAAIQTSSTPEIFQAEFFARFAPRTAADMLAQVPGFVVRGSEGGRGLGQASSNVLINGQRASGKSEDTLSQLARISAKNVVRIELVDAATLDVPGLSGQVANLIVKSGGISGSFAWRPEFRSHYTDPMLRRGEISVSGTTGPVQFTLGLNSSQHRGGAAGVGRFTRVDGTLIERRDDIIRSWYDAPKLTAALKYKDAGTTEANLNFAHQWENFRFRLEEDRFPVAGINSARVFTEQEKERNYEIGGDLAFGLGGGRLKLIGLLRDEHEPYSQQSVESFVTSAAAIGDRFTQVTDKSERIARAEYNWKAGKAEWQLSAEAAFNTLSNSAQLFELDPSGQFQPVPFPGANGGVKEDRYEAILSYGRPLTSRLTLQLTAGGEFSRLAQTGANAVVREFWRPKGSLSLAWAPQKGLDLSLKLRRKVGQLNFGQFLAVVDLNNGNANAGNIDLVPPQSWEFDLEAKKSLGKWGTTTLRVFEYRIDDYIDIIPIGPTGESPGNIDTARRRGIEWTSTFELAALGLKGAKLDTVVYLESSRIADPLTGENRAIGGTNDLALSAEFRQDIPGSELAWGFFANYRHFTDNYRLGAIQLESEGPTFAGLFVEHKDVLGLTVRATYNNLFSGRNYFNRTVWTARRNNSPIAFIEARDRFIGPIFSFQVKGNF
jgi:hypothetical protein